VTHYTSVHIFTPFTDPQVGYWVLTTRASSQT